MKKILVTGGCGFIGSHTALSLLEKGYELIIIDSLVNSFPIVIEKIKNLLHKVDPNSKSQIHFINCDLRDLNSLKKVFQKFSGDNFISAVIHFAGLKAVSESLSFPLRYWNSNVLGTLNLLEVMNEFNCRTLVFSSSATIYGANVKQKNLKEHYLKNPLNTYGETKYTVEKVLNSLIESNKNNWRIAILRYFNPIGAHKSGLIGENSVSKIDNLFPFICQVAAGLKKEIKI